MWLRLVARSSSSWAQGKTVEYFYMLFPLVDAPGALLLQHLSWTFSISHGHTLCTQHMHMEKIAQSYW